MIRYSLRSFFGLCGLLAVSLASMLLFHVRGSRLENRLLSDILTKAESDFSMALLEENLSALHFDTAACRKQISGGTGTQAIFLYVDAFYGWPGGQKKTLIAYDQSSSEIFWLPINGEEVFTDCTVNTVNSAVRVNISGLLRPGAGEVSRSFELGSNGFFEVNNRKRQTGT